MNKQAGKDLTDLPEHLKQPQPPPLAGGQQYQVDAQRVNYHLSQIIAQQATQIALLTAALENKDKKGAF